MDWEGEGGHRETGGPARPQSRVRVPLKATRRSLFGPFQMEYPIPIPSSKLQVYMVVSTQDRRTLQICCFATQEPRGNGRGAGSKLEKPGSGQGPNQRRPINNNTA